MPPATWMIAPAMRPMAAFCVGRISSSLNVVMGPVRRYGPLPAVTSAPPLNAAPRYLLVEGLAAIALALVVLAGIGAVTVSLVECALGLVLAAAVPDGETGRAGTLFHLINRMDGAKMLALAAMALAAAGLARRSGVLPRWL